MSMVHRTCTEVRGALTATRTFWSSAWSGDAVAFNKEYDEVQGDPATLNERISLTNEHGWNALHFAAVYGRVNMIEKLLPHAPELVRKANPAGWEPIHYAAGRF